VNGAVDDKACENLLGDAAPPVVADALTDREVIFNEEAMLCLGQWV
jgi:hypothetical protein